MRLTVEVSPNLTLTVEVPDHVIVAGAADILAAQPDPGRRLVPDTIERMRLYAARLETGKPINGSHHPPGYYARLAEHYTT
jgi:hypothetical protein